jgi:hypothetical protein
MMPPGEKQPARPFGGPVSLDVDCSSALAGPPQAAPGVDALPTTSQAIIWQ